MNDKLTYQELEIQIAELKKQNENLLELHKRPEENERKLKTALESMSDAVFISDTEGNFIDFNEAFATFHKFKNKQECAKPLSDYPHFLDVYFPNGELAPLDKWVVPRALRGETGINEEFTLVRKDTNEKWLGSYNFGPILNSEGQIIGSVVTARDITEIKKEQSELLRAKEKAEENEKIYRALFNSIPDTSILLFDKDLKYIEVGGDEVEKSGFDKSLIKGKTLQEAYPKDVVDLFEPLLQKGFKGEATTFEMQYAQLTYLQQIVPIFDSSGNVFATMQIASNITDKHKAAQALKESEERFRTFVNESPFPIVVTDAQHDEIVYWSKSATKLFGHQPKTTVDWFFLAYPDPQYRQKVIERSKSYMEQAQHSKTAVNTGEYQIVCKDGAVKICEIYAQFISGQLVLSNNDISEKKRAELELKESEDLLRNIIDSSTDYIFVKDKDLKTIICNKVFARALDKKPSDLIGKTDIENGWDTELVKGNPEKGISGYEQDDLEALNGKIVRNTDTATISGKTFYFDSVKIPLKDANDEIFGLLGISRDNTKRVKAEKALVENQRRYEKSQELGHVGNWEYIPENQLFWVSNESKRIYGFDLDSNNFNVEKVESCIPERERVHQALIDLIESDKKYDLEFEIIPADKTPPKIIHSIAELEKDAFNNPLRVWGVILDITKQKKAEQLLKESNASKDKFFSIIAHDLRSPFNNIIGFTELLIENTKEFKDSKFEKYLDIINSSAKNTLVLLDNLLNWAKSETGQIYYNPEKQNLSSIIKEVFKLSKNLAQKKDIVLNYFESEVIVVFADKNMILTILRNLISNAIKYTNSHGKIDIKASQDGKFVEIEVSDNGVGIDEETQKKLFSLASNESTHGTANEKGTGLGLILCKDFVEKHGGKIWVESKLGQGSKFIFKLPSKN